MDFSAVQSQLNDLPVTFKRSGAPYTQWVDALTAGLLLFTEAMDGLAKQYGFDTASGPWLDVYGDLFGVPRRQNEADPTYQARIKNTILARHVTPIAMQQWIAEIEGLEGLIIEALPTVGYTVSLPPTLTTAQVTQVLTDLAYVRPAGVPFVVVFRSGGIYLNTLNYLGAPRVEGAFLPGPTLPVSFVIPAYTTNRLSIMPDILLTDPTINPSLAVPATTT